MSRQTTSTERSASPSTTPIAIVGSSLLACSLVLADVSGPIRPVVVLAFLCLVPGAAVVRLFELDSWPVQASLALALSLALTGVSAGVLLYVHLWSPGAVVLIVAVVSVSATVLEAGGIAAVRARLATLAPGDRLAAAVEGTRRSVATLAPRERLAVAAGALRAYGDLNPPRWPVRAEPTTRPGPSAPRARPAARRVRLPRTARLVSPLKDVRRPHLPIRPRPKSQRRAGAHQIESPLSEKVVVDALLDRRLRRLLTLMTTLEIEPKIWLVEDLELPGGNRGGSMQAGPVGVWVSAVADTLGVPLDWRVLPDDGAQGRRPWRSRLALEAIDGLCELDSTPAVIAAGPGYGSLRGFRAGLEERQLDYLVRVEPAIAFGEFAASNGARDGRGATASRSMITDYLRAQQIELEPFSWTEDGRSGRSAASRVVQSRFGALRMDASGPGARDSRQRCRWLVCEWPDGAEQPVRFWVSNLPSETSISDFASLVTLPARADLAGSRPGNILTGQLEWPTSTASLDLQLTLWVMAEEFRGLKTHRATRAEA